MRRGSRQLKSILNYIDGQFVRGKREFADVNPADGSVIAQVTEADEGLVDDAVQAARKALRGEWARLGIRERAARLHRVADAIEARFDCFVAAEVADTGKPFALASKLDVPRAAANFRVFADVIKTAPLESFQTETPDGKSALNYAVRKPLGVVGIITPWNLPLLLLTWKVAPALACGNTVVVKPSEETPATATLLAEAMKEAGIPDGVYNVVHGFGPNSAGEFLTQHPDVNAVTFTGESQTGAAIMKTVAASVKPVSFELGGKNAAIVFADCDFEEAVNGISEAVFLNTGQVCLCAERVYVERAIFDRFVEALRRKAESLRIGSPLDETTDLGPLISAQHREKVLSYYRLAREEGAEMVTGGGVPAVRQCARQRFLRATDDLYWSAGICALREGRNFRSGVPCRSFRHGRGSREPGERHEVWFGCVDLDDESETRPPRRAADERGHYLGELLVLA